MSSIEKNEEIDYLKNLKSIQEDTSLTQTYAKLNIPPPSLNGGLYTGEPFRQGAGHANIPIIPDAGFMTHYALRSANPPEEALYQYPASIRPGNNTPIMPGVNKYADGKYGIYCQNAPRKTPKPCKCPKCRCSKYFYL